MIRETIYAALVARLTSACGTLLASPIRRKLITYDDVSPADQPTILCICATEQASRRDPHPQIWTLSIELYIYARCDADPYSSAEPTLHAIVDAVEAALKRQPGEAVGPFAQGRADGTTLGGLILSATIDGSVQYFDGAMGLQGIAIVPITMILPDKA